MGLLEILLAVALASWCYLLLSAASAVFYRIEADPKAPAATEAVAVVVPARNEEGRIGAAVRSVLAQRGVGLDLIVVDDESTDATAEEARAAAAGDPRFRVVPAGPLPDGWKGKCHALWRGVETLSSGGGSPAPWLLFLDADTELHPHALRTALAEARGLDLLSVGAAVRTTNALETLLVPALGVALAGIIPMPLVNHPRLRLLGAAAGAFILVRREAYARIGGHAAVRGEIVEDLALGRLAKRLGLRCGLRWTLGLVAAHLYGSPRATVVGLSKHVYAGLGHSPLLLAAVVVHLVVLAGLPPATVAAAAAGAPISAAALGTAAASWSIAALMGAGAYAGVGGRLRHALLGPLLPLSLLLYLGVGLLSALFHHRGGDVWKGRRYAPTP